VVGYGYPWILFSRLVEAKTAEDYVALLPFGFPDSLFDISLIWV
jgi:hypothetical protein